MQFVSTNVYTSYYSQNIERVLLSTDLTKWSLEWRRTVFSVRYELNFMYYLYEIISKINQQINISLPLHQAITFHFYSFIILIILVSEGRAGET